MYKFSVYWTEAEKISFLQRVILIHSYLYYEKDSPVWTDKKFDEVAKQLAELQRPKTAIWIQDKTQYGYAFYDYDGTTGFDLYSRLTEDDKKYIMGIADHIKRRR